MSADSLGAVTQARTELEATRDAAAEEEAVPVLPLLYQGNRNADDSVQAGSRRAKMSRWRASQGGCVDSTTSTGATDLTAARALLDALPFYAFLVDSDHRIVVANRATFAAHGLEPSVIERTHCPQTVHGVDHFPGCPLEASLANGCGITVSEVFDERSGLWFETAIYPTGYRTSTDRPLFFHTARDITSAKRAEEGLEHRAQVQAVLASLLRIALRDVPLEDQLGLLLSEIQSTPWLTLESKGAVFLVDGDVLAMEVHNGLSESVASSCARVAFGQCHCGMAAQSGEIQFAEHLDERHRPLTGMLPHGHYCLPLQSPRGLLGVLCLYLPDGHQRSEAEEGFLRSVADIMAAIVEKARASEQTYLLRRELERSEQALERLAYYDPLTELPNRALLVERTRQAMAGAGRVGHRVAICVLEVDRFHTWKETLGLGGGDRLLLAAAKRLGATIRESDTLARTGGYEFTLLIAPCEGVDGCTMASAEQLSHGAETCSIAVAGRLRASFAEPLEIDGLSVALTVSGGIAVFPEDGRECETLLHNASCAMRRARELGGDRFEFYDVAMSERARLRLSLEAELRIAIESEQLVMHYQPQVELRHGRIVGAEALVRWQHPTVKSRCVV